MDWVSHVWARSRLEWEHVSDEYMGHKVIEIVLGLLVAATGSVLLYQTAGRYLINYRLKENEVQIIVCGVLPVKRIPIDKIVDVQRLSAKEAWTRMLVWEGREAFCAQAWGNRVWGDALVIRKRARLFELVILTPDNADDFAEEIRRRMHQQPENPNIARATSTETTRSRMS